MSMNAIKLRATHSTTALLCILRMKNLSVITTSMNIWKRNPFASAAKIEIKRICESHTTYRSMLRPFNGCVDVTHMAMWPKSAVLLLELLKTCFQPNSQEEAVLRLGVKGGKTACEIVHGFAPFCETIAAIEKELAQETHAESEPGPGGTAQSSGAGPDVALLGAAPPSGSQHTINDDVNPAESFKSSARGQADRQPISHIESRQSWTSYLAF